MRQPLRYFGGKASVADWIVSHFPPHEAYLEPFGGGAAVLLRKPRATLETYNDLSRDAVTFFKVLRDQPAALIRAITLTPFARAEVEQAHDGRDHLDDVERARRFYVISWQTRHGAPAHGGNGWRQQIAPEDAHNAAQWAIVDHLGTVAKRLTGVQIERCDALKAIDTYQHPECLIYADPPYLGETRGARWAKAAYQHELIDEGGHRTLAESLRAARGAVLVSGYAHPLYTALYADWTIVMTAARNQAHAATVECLWLNDRAADAVRQRPLPFAEDVDVAYSHGVA